MLQRKARDRATVHDGSMCRSIVAIADMKVADVKHSTTTPLVSKDISTTEETNCCSRSSDANLPDKEKNRVEKEEERKKKKRGERLRGASNPLSIRQIDPERKREGTKKDDLGRAVSRFVTFILWTRMAALAQRNRPKWGKEEGRKSGERWEGREGRKAFSGVR